MYNIDPHKFGERLKNAIKSAGTTQKNLAEKIDISKTALNNYVGGRIPDATILYSICKSLNVTMEWLLAGEDLKTSNILIDKEEDGLMNLYNKCSENQKEDVLKNIRSYLSDPNYTFKKSINALSEDEIKIIELFRQLNSKDKIKIEGIIESKIIESKELQKGKSSLYQNGDEDAATEEKPA
jgi:transcriptional regulator with XRE-family HTH domain